MHLEFISRAAYRKKNEDSFLHSLQNKYPKFYIIPEGGTNALAIDGCREILTEADHEFDVICCAVGTGGTISGLINSSLPHQKIIGFPALKGTFLREDICKFAQQSNWDLCHEYHFGGYAKVNLELIQFITGPFWRWPCPLAGWWAITPLGYRGKRWLVFSASWWSALPS